MLKRPRALHNRCSDFPIPIHPLQGTTRLSRRQVSCGAYEERALRLEFRSMSTTHLRILVSYLPMVLNRKPRCWTFILLQQRTHSVLRQMEAGISPVIQYLLCLFVTNGVVLIVWERRVGEPIFGGVVLWVDKSLFNRKMSDPQSTHTWRNHDRETGSKPSQMIVY